MAKTTQNLLDKAGLLAAASAVRTEPLPLPELGGIVYIKQQTAGEREALERLMKEQVDKNGVRAAAFVTSVCDEAGNLLFDESDIEDVKKLQSKVVVKVFNKANELNGIGDDAVDTAEKNS